MPMAATEISFYTFKGTEDGRIVKTPGRRTLGAGETVVRITHSGVCGTDEHARGSDCALGHEGVGVIEKVAPDVTSVKVGDRVGFGYFHWTCGECDACLKGMDNYCENRRNYMAHDTDQGSFGSHVVWPAKTLYRIPDAIESKYAGPLMCGGATVYGALAGWGGVAPGDRVGVLGVGGLGHLAIQFAEKMGGEVVVFSGTLSKKEEAMKFGASEFYAAKGVKKFEGIKKLDHLVITASEDIDYDLYIPLIAPGGKIYPLTVTSGHAPISLLPITLDGLSIQGSCISTHLEGQKMLEFAVKHNIQAQIMEWPMTEEGITDAMETLKQGKMRYRAVLVA